MCGIVAVLARRSARQPVGLADALGALAEAQDRLHDVGDGALRPEVAWSVAHDVEAIAAATDVLRTLDRDLRGPVGLRTLLGDPSALDKLATAVTEVGERIAGIEAFLDRDVSGLGAPRHEERSQALTALKDGWWALWHDRLGLARAVRQLLADPARPTALDAWWAVGVALAALDRLEVRGRDSVGLHVLVEGHGLDLAAPDVAAEVARRSADPTFLSGAVRADAGCLGFVYKAAAEVGELGDNVRALRAAVGADRLLARAVEGPDVQVTVLGHTRWASVGLVSEANAHPMSADEVGRPPSVHLAAALNGDVDNHADLRAAAAMALPPAVTTDAKVVPVLVARRLGLGSSMEEAFRGAVTTFLGSVAVALSGAPTPDSVHLALRGSGQALYVGLAEDAFVVTSEPYGLVEETDRYLRMDGEATRGQVVVLHRADAGTVAGIHRCAYDGRPLPVAPDEVVHAEITTRDVDRRGYPHYLLKELSEAPASFRKTLRGRVVAGADGELRALLGPAAVPDALGEAVAGGSLRRVVVVGQGTAAVAGQAVAAAVARLVPALAVSAMPASELSGYALADDMADTLVVAVSQSGTTTDTNRAVDLARARGAHVVAIVNRRHSDLVTKAHGVLYTSDGRDVEMSVASTKAFYAQVAAGWLLAVALAQAAGIEDAANRRDRDGVIRALKALPEAMAAVLERREEIGRIARAVAPQRRFWAVVGSGPDRVAAAEVRIKLSELCYRSIGCDATEDKKHIDLSSEPLVLVCAASLQPSTADDVAKEVAIFRAHRAVPVVVTAESQAPALRTVCDRVVAVPDADPAVAFVLSAVAGHLFGYEAALAIDAQARALRALRAELQRVADLPENDLLARLRLVVAARAAPVLASLADGSHDGTLQVGTAVRLASLLRAAAAAEPVDAYERAQGAPGSPGGLLADLFAVLGRAIDELARPVDAVKHQAKTVTVGTSRRQADLLGSPLAAAVLAAGAPAERLGYRALRSLAALGEAVADTVGFTRYRLDWVDGDATVAVVAQGGIARRLPSRTAADPRLRGTKHRVAQERRVTVARGAADGRTVVLVPEVAEGRVTGITLLHVELHPRLPAEAAARVLRHYGDRYAALADAVMETEHAFDEARLADVPVVDLLTEPVSALAGRWREA